MTDKQDAQFDLWRKYVDFEDFNVEEYMEQNEIHSKSAIGDSNVAMRIFKGRGKIFRLPENPTIDMLCDAYRAGFVEGANYYKNKRSKYDN